MLYVLRKSGKCVHFPAERINAFPTMLYDRLLDKPRFEDMVFINDEYLQKAR